MNKGVGIFELLLFLTLFALSLLCFSFFVLCFLFLDRAWNRKALLKQAREEGKEREGVLRVSLTSGAYTVTYFSICVEDTQAWKLATRMDTG